MAALHMRPGEDAGAAEAALWAEFGRDRTVEAYERLVAMHLPFARVMAAKLYAARTHREVEFDEYLQYARVGLMEAVNRFDSARGFKFQTYAASRITGAILNGMRSYSEIHEQVAARKRIVSERVASLEAGAPAVAPDEAGAVFARLAEIAIGLALGFALDDTGMVRDEHAEPELTDQTYTGVELRQLKRRLRALVEALPERQRQVMSCHYLQQMPFEEIAARLELTRGRISQIHKEALARLRAGLDPGAGLDLSG